MYARGNALIRKDGEYPLFDGLGSERTVTNSSQTVTGTITFEGFGQAVATTGSSTDPYMFAATSGCRNDGDAGLSLVGARYYDAQVGRFITRDTDLNQHPYAYCNHDPINYVDPTGHDGETLEMEIGMARAIAEKNVEQAGTLIESVTDSDTAAKMEETLRQAFQQLPSKMSRSEGVWRKNLGYIKGP